MWVKTHGKLSETHLNWTKSRQQTKPRKNYWTKSTLFNAAEHIFYCAKRCGCYLLCGMRQKADFFCPRIWCRFIRQERRLIQLTNFLPYYTRHNTVVCNQTNFAAPHEAIFRFECVGRMKKSQFRVMFQAKTTLFHNIHTHTQCERRPNIRNGGEIEEMPPKHTHADWRSHKNIWPCAPPPHQQKNERQQAKPISQWRVLCGRSLLSGTTL